MDSFGEQLVRKQTSSADIIKRVALVVGGLLLATALMTASFLTNFYVLTLLAVGVIFGMGWLLTGLGCEYEYIITNQDLDIDKIMGKRKRKRLITVKLDTVEDFGIYDGTQGEGAQATVIASDATGINAWYIIAKHKTHGRTMLIFSPNKKTVGLIANGLPHKLKVSLKLPENILSEDE
ncbi:MAG: hypothetical protein J1E39_02640 [Eubacterium sp.]|nr:hypothetical protein [Eubacterium sp.]